MGLQHADAVVIVNDQARQAVTLTMHQTVAGGSGRCSQTASFPQRVGAGQHPQPEIRLRGVLVEAEDTHGNGANLVMAAAEHATVRGADAHEVSLGGMALDLGDGPGEYPGMETQEGLLPAGFQDDFIHCLGNVQGEAVRASGDSFRKRAASGTSPGRSRHPWPHTSADLRTDARPPSWKAAGPWRS